MGVFYFLTSISYSTEERDEEGNAEIHDEAMEDGERGKVLTTITRDDRQGGVHGGRATHTDRS